MSACKKCGYDEELETCQFCGFLGPQAHVLGNFGGVLKTLCCQVNPKRPPKVLPKDREEVNSNG